MGRAVYGRTRRNAWAVELRRLEAAMHSRRSLTRVRQSDPKRSFIPSTAEPSPGDRHVRPRACPCAMLPISRHTDVRLDIRTPSTDSRNPPGVRLVTKRKIAMRTASETFAPVVQRDDALLCSEASARYALWRLGSCRSPAATVTRFV